MCVCSCIVLWYLHFIYSYVIICMCNYLLNSNIYCRLFPYSCMKCSICFYIFVLFALIALINYALLRLLFLTLQLKFQFFLLYLSASIFVPVNCDRVQHRHRRRVRLSVCLSVCLSHADINSKLKTIKSLSLTDRKSLWSVEWCHF